MPTHLVRSAREAKELLDYNRTVFERFRRKVRRLRGDAAMREREIGHHSLFGTLVHILNVHEAWLVYIARGRLAELSRRFEEEDRRPTDWAGLDRYAARVWAGASETVRRLSEKDLRRIVRAPWMPGRYSVADAFLQTTIEQAHHLGVVIGALWQDDVPSSRMTWIEVATGPAR